MEKKLVFDMKSSKLILAIGQCSKCVKCAQAILARFCHEFSLRFLSRTILVRFESDGRRRGRLVMRDLIKHDTLLCHDSGPPKEQITE